ncbi:type II toxin-antitoxin system VapB family antitoxin [Desulfosarcina variabilis]|uniref:type II toxin-antitoxin system VapB family antitoxin n=1 Tax=Desulfosarcina variabilis TaxID=2300 RepID=UPI003AFB7EA6
MRTTLNINDEALAAAIACAPELTKTEIINEALRRFVRAKHRKELLLLRGKVKWEGNLDDLRKRS